MASTIGLARLDFPMRPAAPFGLPPSPPPTSATLSLGYQHQQQQQSFDVTSALAADATTNGGSTGSRPAMTLDMSAVLGRDFTGVPSPSSHHQPISATSPIVQFPQHPHPHSLVLSPVSPMSRGAAAAAMSASPRVPVGMSANPVSDLFPTLSFDQLAALASSSNGAPNESMSMPAAAATPAGFGANRFPTPQASPASPERPTGTTTSNNFQASSSAQALTINLGASAAARGHSPTSPGVSSPLAGQSGQNDDKAAGASSSSDDADLSGDDAAAAKDLADGGSAAAGKQRSRLSREQMNALKRVYSNTYFPDKAQKEQLSRDLGIPVRTIQIWFQNQRQYHRLKLKKKATQKQQEEKQARQQAFMHAAAAQQHQQHQQAFGAAYPPPSPMQAIGAAGPLQQFQAQPTSRRNSAPPHFFGAVPAGIPSPYLPTANNSLMSSPMVPIRPLGGDHHHHQQQMSSPALGHGHGNAYSPLPLPITPSNGSSVCNSPMIPMPPSRALPPTAGESGFAAAINPLSPSFSLTHPLDTSALACGNGNGGYGMDASTTTTATAAQAQRFTSSPSMVQSPLLPLAPNPNPPQAQVPLRRPHAGSLPPLPTYLQQQQNGFQGQYHQQQQQQVQPAHHQTIPNQNQRPMHLLPQLQMATSPQPAVSPSAAATSPYLAQPSLSLAATASLQHHQLAAAQSPSATFDMADVFFNNNGMLPSAAESSASTAASFPTVSSGLSLSTLTSGFPSPAPAALGSPAAQDLFASSPVDMYNASSQHQQQMPFNVAPHPHVQRARSHSMYY
ncbi:hypothetical protein H9P43_002403 [Blastocladiella emersonii ATCC 22665]|nr:hypothetical protein H9P43_002403 [Blastocladiella emersonii ATCC 22665]